MVDPPALDILLLLRSCTEQFPPTVNQANILAEAGYRVGLVDLSSRRVRQSTLHPDIYRLQVHEQWESKDEAAWPLPLRIRRLREYARACGRVYRTAKPAVVIGYDRYAFTTIPPSNHHRSIFHFHELLLPQSGAGPHDRYSMMRLGSLTRRAGLVVFPDRHRARAYRRIVRLEKTPLVAMNCPRLIPQVPTSSLAQDLQAHGFAGYRSVGFVGSIGPDKGFDDLVRSIGHWPEDTCLVLVGDVSAEFRLHMESLAPPKRLLFLGPRPHAEALNLMAGFTIGVALLQPGEANWRFTAGASNKRFEYMAMGVPQVTDNGPGVRNLVQDNGVGLCANPANPTAIAQAICTILHDPNELSQMGQTARLLHENELHYERQFQPVLEWIAEGKSRA